jgi:hypothetical protein
LYADKLYTYAGLAKLYLKTQSEEIATLMATVDAYIAQIVSQIVIKEKK